MLALLLVTSALSDPGHRAADSAELGLHPPREAPAVGAWRAVATPGLRPCARPAPPCAGAPLAVGANLVVAAVQDAIHDGGRLERWLQVRAGSDAQDPGFFQGQGPALGWVRPGDLTQAAFEADLDGDGAPEVVALRFTEAVTVEAWVARPGQGTAPDRAQHLDLGARADIEGPQERATATLLPASAAGIPLVRVRWHAREQCGSGDWFAYVSHRSEPGAPAQPRLALSHMGSGGDAPIWWETDVSWAPADRIARVRHRAGEHGDDGDQSVHHDEVKVFVREGGVYREQHTNP